MVKLPRLLIGAPASGEGKTMLTIGIMSALTRRGLKVAPFKVGPDYIDPGYHTLATGVPSRNLDPILCGEQLISPLLAYGAQTPTTADIAIIEGVMGLFDGKLGQAGFGSGAHIGKLTNTPILLCVDASSTSRTIAATVAGIHQFDPGVKIAGVVFNKVSSPRHRDEIVDAMGQVKLPIAGFIPESSYGEAPSRHLGLVPAQERPQAGAKLERFADLIEQNIDLTLLMDLARTAPDLETDPWNPIEHVQPQTGQHPVIAVAGGKAFTFRYPETTELFAAGGCQIVEFDPITQTQLPENIAGLYLGGGFPEVHLGELARNTKMLENVRQAVLDGVPTLAECAGMLYLGQSLDGKKMVGALPHVGEMGTRLTMGYRVATAPSKTLLAEQGEQVTGNEFHRTIITPAAGTCPAWSFDNNKLDGFSTGFAGRKNTLLASYLHLHLAGYPKLAGRFVSAVHDFSKEQNNGV